MHWLPHLWNRFLTEPHFCRLRRKSDYHKVWHCFQPTQKPSSWTLKWSIPQQRWGSSKFSLCLNVYRNKILKSATKLKNLTKISNKITTYLGYKFFKKTIINVLCSHIKYSVAYGSTSQLAIECCGSKCEGAVWGADGYDFSTNNRCNVQKHALILLKDAKL